MEILFTIVPILVAVVFILTFAMILSPKLRGIMMKATKYMLDENEENLKDMATKSANISKEGIEITTRAIKDGLTKESKYCKYCGEAIDEDSKYCKKCGERQ